MKTYFKKNTRFLVLTLCLYVVLGLFTFADDWQIEIYSDGMLLEPVDAIPYLNEDGRTMVPVRFMSEALGAEVSWVEETQSVLITKDKTEIAFQVNSDIVIINGQSRQMDTKMILEANTGRTFVPLRFAVEPLGIGIGNVEFLDDQLLKIELDNSPSLFNLRIGTAESEVLRQYGQPTSKGLSAFGYEWWFYADDYLQYMQIGMANNEVVVIYTNSGNWTYENTYRGLSVEELKSTFDIEDPIKIDFDNVSLTISQASDQSLGKERYLYIKDDVAIEWFFDLHDGGVTSIRVSKMPYVLTQVSYQFSYSYPQGSMPDYSSPILSPEEQIQVDNTNSLMLFYLTNATRASRELNILTFDEEVSKLSLSHSVDMQTNDFFDHHSPTTGGLGDRFEAWNISFRSISENIAFGQADGVFAHEGLMNSLGHRKNILSISPTQVGVGSYYRYYTINFKEAIE